MLSIVTGFIFVSNIQKKITSIEDSQKYETDTLGRKGL